MARRFLTDIELLGFALLNAKLHPVSADPTGLGAGDAGRVWFNTTLNGGSPMIWDGTAAINLLDLAQTIGSLTASRISDFTSAVRTGNSVAQLAAPAAALAMNGQKITGLADGTITGDAVTFQQLTAVANNRSFKDSVRAASTGNVATLSGPQTIDGVSLVAGDRVLLKDQTTATANGIYVVATGAWARALDADAASELLPGTIVGVQEGTANLDKLFMLVTNGPIVIGTSPLSFQSYGAGGGTITTIGADNGLTGGGSSSTVSLNVGQGTGIVVNTNDVAVDFGIVAQKLTAPIPPATAGKFTVAGANVTVNHGLANLSPIVQVTTGAVAPAQAPINTPVEVDYVITDANNLVITLPAAPVAGNYIVTVIG